MLHLSWEYKNPVKILEYESFNIWYYLFYVIFQPILFALYQWDEVNQYVFGNIGMLCCSIFPVYMGWVADKTAWCYFKMYRHLLLPSTSAEAMKNQKDKKWSILPQLKVPTGAIYCLVATALLPVITAPKSNSLRVRSTQN